MGSIESFARIGIYKRQTIVEAVHILALVINQFTGGDAIYDTRHVRDDPAVRAIFGDIHIPAATTSGDFLERFTEDATDKLRQIIWKMQEKYLKRLARRLQKRIVISIDSSIYEIYGNTREQSSMSYKNIFGFHPLLLHIHDTGELLDIIFRGGKIFTSVGAVDMLETNVHRLQRYFDEIILLCDAGFYEKNIVDFCEKDEIQIKFIITSEQNKPILNKLSDPELEWRDFKKNEHDQDSETRKRNSGTTNHRLAELKKALATKGKALKVRGPLEVAEFNHTVAAWKREYRFVYKRQLIMEQTTKNQTELFDETDEYFYHGYVTNIEDGEIEDILVLAHSRGHQENFIKDFKNGLGTVHIPTKHFYGNYAYFLVSMLSWNLKCWLLYVIEPKLKIHWKRFRYLFVKVGAQVIKSGGYVIIRFSKGFSRTQEFSRWYTRLQRFPTA